MKKMALFLCLALLFPAAAFADNLTLPDPGLSFFAAGELLFKGLEADGVLYDVYGYTFEKKTSTLLSSTVEVFQAKVKKAGFTWEKLEDKSDENTFTTVGDSWYSIADGDLTAQLCVTGSYFRTSCTATLYVPEGIPFTLEEEVGSRTQFQNDVFVFANDTQFQNDIFGFDNDLTTGSSGVSAVTCVLCHGSGRCSFCKGTGTYTNPYTGGKKACSCDHGICSVCDGTGRWGK